MACRLAGLVALLGLVGCGRIGYAPASDGGEADAGGIDATRADAGSPVCPATLFCEDFEDPVDSALWSLSTSGTGSLDRATVAARSGAFGLLTSHSGDVAAVQQAFVERPMPPALTTGRLFVQFEAFVTAPAATTWSVLFELVADARLSFGLVPGGSAATVDLDGTPMFAWMSVELPRDRWVCVGLEVDLATTAGATGRVSISFDDEIVGASATGLQTVPLTGWQSLRFGIISGANQVPVELRFDSIRVSTEPLGCR